MLYITDSNRAQGKQEKERQETGEERGALPHASYARLPDASN